MNRELLKKRSTLTRKRSQSAFNYTIKYTDKEDSFSGASVTHENDDATHYHMLTGYTHLDMGYQQQLEIFVPHAKANGTYALSADSDILIHHWNTQFPYKAYFSIAGEISIVFMPPNHYQATFNCEAKQIFEGDRAETVKILGDIMLEYQQLPA